MIEKIREALYFSKLMSYAQGFAQLRAASEEYGWDLPFGEIAKIWRAGCIIRAQFLQKITDAYEKNPALENLLLDEYFVEITKNINKPFVKLLRLLFKQVFLYQHSHLQLLITILIVQIAYQRI